MRTAHGWAQCAERCAAAADAFDGCSAAADHGLVPQSLRSGGGSCQGRVGLYVLHTAGIVGKAGDAQP